MNVILLAYISFVLSAVWLLVALTNLLFRQPLPLRSCGSASLVSVLIPARDEERNIGGILYDLQEQDYPNLEILVYDDFSTDKTAEIISEWATGDKRIRLVEASGLPDGWTGKNHACHMLSKIAGGDYLLFLDADVRLDRDIISRAVAFSERSRPGLLSVFPGQLMITPGERITVPIMNFILLSLLPLILVWKSAYKSLAAANGQFMFFDAAKYHELSPHEKVNGSMVEDIEIARYFKRKNVKIVCTTGISGIKCRMYEGFREAVNGFSKNVFAFFGNSPLLSILFWFFTTFGFIFVALTFTVTWVGVYLGILILTRIIISFISKQNIVLNLILAIPQQFALGWIICSALINRHIRQYQWKGRTYLKIFQ